MRLKSLSRSQAARSNQTIRLRLQLQHHADIGVGDRDRGALSPIARTGYFQLINARFQFHSRLIRLLNVQRVGNADPGLRRIDVDGERIAGLFQIDKQSHIIFGNLYAGFLRDIPGMTDFDFINAGG